MSEQAEIPKGSVAIGRRVKLPRGAGEPFGVYINGVEQELGCDYEVRAGGIVFTRPIIKEEKLGFWRWASLWIGLVGTYRKNESVDVEYTLRGEKKLAADVEILPD